jgi:crossover junction endodeoxyribonuclease RuvC
MSSRPTAYRVLGIDPGLHITGYAALDFGRSAQPAIVEAGALRPAVKGELAERVFQLHSDVAGVLGDLEPDIVVIEQLYAHYKHPRTSILMAHARGIILLACRQAQVAVRHVAATHVKKSLTGNGHASKLQMQRSVQSLFRLDELPQPPDVADAIAIALCGGRKLGSS